MMEKLLACFDVTGIAELKGKTVTLCATIGRENHMPCCAQLYGNHIQLFAMKSQQSDVLLDATFLDYWKHW